MNPDYKAKMVLYITIGPCKGASIYDVRTEGGGGTFKSRHTGCPEDHLFFHIPLISGISGQIRLIFHMLNKQRLRFDLVYRTLGYIFMYLRKSGISLRQA